MNERQVSGSGAEDLNERVWVSVEAVGARHRNIFLVLSESVRGDEILLSAFHILQRVASLQASAKGRLNKLWPDVRNMILTIIFRRKRKPSQRRCHAGSAAGRRAKPLSGTIPCLGAAVAAMSYRCILFASKL